MTRYAVIRVPSSGPPALIAPPNDIATEAETHRRIAAAEQAQLMAHHIYLDMVAYEGPLMPELSRRGVLF